MQAREAKIVIGAEEAWRREHALTSAVLDTAGSLVIVLDRPGRIVRFNRACEELTGYAAADVMGKKPRELSGPAAPAGQLKALLRRLSVGGYPNRYENCWLTRGGSRRWIVWSNTALRNDAGVVEYIISSGLDVTERKRLEKEILEISDMERRRIGQDLHDGICQQLAGIELMSQVLGQNLAKRSKHAASQAAQIALHVRETIRQTRDLARGLSPVELDAEGLAAAMEELAETSARMFNVSCSYRSKGLIPVRDSNVATHLYRIAQEAVSNAIRHGKARGIEIELGDHGGKVVLSVKDNGLGLPRDVSPSKGMGLRIMNYRAGLIGGSLSVQRGARGGTVVLCAIEESSLPNQTDRGA